MPFVVLKACDYCVSPEEDANYKEGLSPWQGFFAFFLVSIARKDFRIMDLGESGAELGVTPVIKHPTSDT